MIPNSAYRKFPSNILGLLFLVFVGVLTSSHVYVARKGSAYSGYLLVADHIFEIGLALSLVALCAAVGGTILDRFEFRFKRALDEVVFSAAVGCGSVSTILLVSGLLLGPRTATFAVVAVMSTIFARARIRAFPDLLARGLLELNSHTYIFCRLTLGIAALFMVSQAILPPTDWDSLMYHLRVPAQFLLRGRIFVPEDNYHVAYVQLIHMLYLPLLDVGSLAGPSLLSGFFAVLLGLAVLTFSERFFTAATASFSLALLWASTMLLLVAITPRVDVTLGYFLFLAHFALFIAWTDWRFYYLSAVLLGFAFGVKYNALLYVAALAPLIAYVTFCKTSNVSPMIRCLTGFFLLFVFSALPWLIKNWLLLGAPLYPFFVQAKINSWLTTHYSDQVFSGSLNEKILSMLGEVRSRFNLVDLFFNPSSLTVEQEALAYKLNPLFLCLAFWFISPNKRIMNCVLIPALSYLCILLFFSPKTNLRYIIPVIAPLTIVAVDLTIMQVTRVVGGKRATIAMCLITLVALWPTIQMITLWTLNKERAEYLAGFSSREDYLISNVFPPDYYPAAQVASYINQHLTPSDRVLMLFEARGFYFKVPVIQDNMLTNWPLLSSKLAAIGCMEATGISHVLVNGGALSFYLKRGLSPDLVRWKQFHEFADKCLSPVYQGVGHILYEVKHGKTNTSP